MYRGVQISDFRSFYRNQVPTYNILIDEGKHGEKKSVGHV